jgi:hypothetical protein
MLWNSLYGEGLSGYRHTSCEIRRATSKHVRRCRAKCILCHSYSERMVFERGIQPRARLTCISWCVNSGDLSHHNPIPRRCLVTCRNVSINVSVCRGCTDRASKHQVEVLHHFRLLDIRQHCDLLLLVSRGKSSLPTNWGTEEPLIRKTRPKANRWKRSMPCSAMKWWCILRMRQKRRGTN